MPVDRRDRILTTKDPTPNDAMLLQQFIMNLPCFSSVFRSMFGVRCSEEFVCYGMNRQCFCCLIIQLVCILFWQLELTITLNSFTTFIPFKIRILFMGMQNGEMITLFTGVNLTRSVHNFHALASHSRTSIRNWLTHKRKKTHALICLNCILDFAMYKNRRK